MSIERFLVLAVQYKETQESLVDKLVKQMENTIIENHGEVRRSYACMRRQVRVEAKLENLCWSCSHGSFGSSR